MPPRRRETSHSQAPRDVTEPTTASQETDNTPNFLALWSKETRARRSRPPSPTFKAGEPLQGVDDLGHDLSPDTTRVFKQDGEKDEEGLLDPKSGVYYTQGTKDINRLRSIVAKAAQERGIGMFAASKEQRKEWNSTAGKASGKAAQERGTGIFAASKKQCKEWSSTGGKIGGKIGGKAAQERSKGIFAGTEQQLRDWRSAGGKAVKEQGTGIFAGTEQERRDRSSAAGKASKEQGTGIFAGTEQEQKAMRSAVGKANRDQGRGIFAGTEEERRDWSSAGGKASGKSRVERNYRSTLPDGQTDAEWMLKQYEEADLPTDPEDGE